MKSDAVQPETLQYILTSSSWQGEITLTYGATQLLVNCDLSHAELSEKQHIWFLRNLPRELAELQQLVEKTETATLTKAEREISFDEFWARYKAPANSKKKKALACWARLSQTDRQRAYRHVAAYERNMQPWQTKMYAETYLNAELWNN